MGLKYKEQQPQIIINYAQQQLVSQWIRENQRWYYKLMVTYQGQNILIIGVGIFQWN